MDKDIIFTDTETTGLVEALGVDLSIQPHITEVAIIRTTKKLKELDRYVTLIKPPMPILPHIVKITGITDEMVAKKKPYSKHHKKIQKIFKNAHTMVAQNLRFDYDMYSIEAQRIKKKFKFPPQLFCTVEQSMHLMGFRLKSTELYQIAMSSEIAGIHRAEADTEAMIHYYELIRSGIVPEHLIGVLK